LTITLIYTAGSGPVQRHLSSYSVDLYTPASNTVPME